MLLSVPLPLHAPLFEMKRQECVVTEVPLLLQQYPSVAGTTRGVWLPAPLHRRNAAAAQWEGEGNKHSLSLPLTLTLGVLPEWIRWQLIRRQKSFFFLRNTFECPQ